MTGQRVGMKPGEAFKIRLLPREIMVCAAVVERVRSDARALNLSLAQVVRFALTELCEAAVASGLVAEPDEFDYEQVVSPYRRGSLGRKVETSRLILQAQMDRTSAGGSAASGGLRFAAEHADPEVEEIRRNMNEPTARSSGGRSETLGGRSERIRELLAGEAHATHPKSERSTNKRTRADPRRLRLAELTFRSEQDPANVSPAEFRELRKLQRAVG